mgnify:CR=1 FL=1
MNANELKTKARERLAEIAKERAALDAEEREIRVMLGDIPPAGSDVLPKWEELQRALARETVQPMVRPMPYDVRPSGPSDWPPPPGVVVTCAKEDHALSHGVITSRTTGCAVIPTIPGRIGAEHSTPDEGIVYGAAS